MSTLITNIKQAFIEHPHEIGESYSHHLRYTMKMSSIFLGLSLTIIIHGIFPFLFTHTASNRILQISKNMRARAQKSTPEES